MNKSEAEVVIKDTIEYANQEIKKNKKRTRKWIIGIIIAFSVLLIAGITVIKMNTPTENATRDTNVLIEYSQNDDGSWECDGHTYKYKLEISGRMPNAAVDSTFVYLSNSMDITFEQAWKAAGLSSDSNDYFDVEDAVLVEWN